MPRILDAVHEVNVRQKTVLAEKIVRHFGGQLGRHDDRASGDWRSSRAPTTSARRRRWCLIDALLARGANVRVTIPRRWRTCGGSTASGWSIAIAATTRLCGADALAILTEWKQFVHPDFDEMRRLMRQPGDLRRPQLYDPARMREAGFTYYSIGRPAKEP